MLFIVRKSKKFPSSSNECQLYTKPLFTYHFTELLYSLKQTKPQQNSSKFKPHTTSFIGKFHQPLEIKARLQRMHLHCLFLPWLVFSPHILHSLLPETFLSEAHFLSLLFALRSNVSLISMISFRTCISLWSPQPAYSLLKIKEGCFPCCFEQPQCENLHMPLVHASLISVSLSVPFPLHFQEEKQEFLLCWPFVHHERWAILQNLQAVMTS